MGAIVSVPLAGTGYTAGPWESDHRGDLVRYYTEGKGPDRSMFRVAHVIREARSLLIEVWPIPRSQLIVHRDRMSIGGSAPLRWELTAARSAADQRLIEQGWTLTNPVTAPNPATEVALWDQLLRGEP